MLSHNYFGNRPESDVNAFWSALRPVGLVVTDSN
jgi:hypothetical protein